MSTTARKSAAKPAKTRRKPKLLSYCDAAEQILKDVKKALKYKELSDKAHKKEILRSESATPDISMYVSLRGEIKRRQERNEAQRFKFLGNGIFTLVELITGAPAKKTKSAIEQVRESRQEAYKALDKALTSKNQGTNFETMTADLLIAMGYEDVEVIGGHDDRGVDILCEKRDGIMRARFAIQCKCIGVSKQVGPKDVSTLRDNLSTYSCQQGIIVTTSVLNDDAKGKASETGKERIHFIERSELFDLFASNGIGLRSEEVRFFQLDASQYDFLN